MKNTMITYRFNDSIDDGLRKYLISLADKENLDPTKFCNHLEEVYESIENNPDIKNISAYMKACVSKDESLFRYKKETYYFHFWLLNKELFKEFNPENKIDKAVFGDCLTYALNCGKMEGTAWLEPLLQKMDAYFKEHNITSWKTAVEVLISCSTLKNCCIPVEKIRQEAVQREIELQEILRELQDGRASV